MRISTESIATAIFRFAATALVLIACNSRAATRVEATITVTNTAAIGDLVQFNSQSRWWTNNTLASTNWIITTNSAKATTTNLFAHAVANPFSNVVQIAYASPTSLVFYANFDTALSGSVTGSWATISFKTNYVQTSGPVTMPYPTNVTETFRTNQMTALMESLRTNSQIAPLATGAFSNLVDRTTPQGISGKAITGSTNSGYIGALTNGYVTNLTLGSPKMTNAVNYGSAFSSPGTNTQSQQFGQGATASGIASLAVGYSASSPGVAAVALGYQAAASATNSIACGLLASASGLNSMSIGNLANSTAKNSIAIGYSSSATDENSISIGYSVASSATNQIRLGGAQDVVIGGLLYSDKGATNFALLGITTNSALVKNGTYTNAVLQNPVATNLQSVGISSTASNRIGGALVVVSTNITTAANGANNLSIASDTTWLVVSGPTAAWSISGIKGAAAISAGRVLWIQNNTAYPLTLSHLSGLESTAGFRLSNPSGFDEVIAAYSSAMIRHNGTYWIVTYTTALATTVYWNDNRPEMFVNTQRAATNQPVWAVIQGTVYAQGFDPATNQYLDFRYQVSHGITTNDAYGIHPHLHWTVTNAASTTSNVVWVVEMSIGNPFQLLTNYTIRATNYCGTNLQHLITELPTLYGLKESAMVIGNIQREGLNASDTHPTKAFILSFDFHEPIIRPGSVAEYGDY